MREWKQLNWGDIATLEYGKGLQNYLHDDGQFPVFGTNGRIGTTNIYLCPFPSVIIGRKGAYRGVHYSATPFFVIDTAFYLKPLIKDLDLKYAYYQLKTIDIDLMDSGSAIPSTSREDFYGIEVNLPPIEEQRAIAEVLSSLDDKIDLLHRQNKTLESLAETLFRRWFMEEAEEKLANGKTYKLGNLIDTISDTFKFTDDEVIFLNTSDIYGGTVLTHELSSPGILPGQAKKRIKKNDILYSEIRPANKRYAFIDFDAANYVVSTKLMVLRVKPNFSPAIIYFYLTHPDTLEWLQMIAESRSGTFPQITFDQVKEMTINFPDEKRLNQITEWAESTVEKISRNREQIQALTKLRENLLPKLMSGQVHLQLKRRDL